MTGRSHSRIDRLCTTVALAGAALLLALVVLETGSVVGRSLPELLSFTGLNLAPRALPGDNEIAQALTATALFSFLPYCQRRGGHIRVEVFSSWMPERLTKVLDAAWAALFAVLATLLAWRLLLGCLNKWSNGDTSMVLHIPEALPIGAATLCTMLLVVSVVWPPWHKSSETGRS
jgi:TRAP-type mannitol/chloroaromatic compound transport system permease small subunit